MAFSTMILALFLTVGFVACNPFVAPSKYDKLVDGVLDRIFANETVFKGFHHYYGQSIRRGDNKFNTFEITETNVIKFKENTRRTEKTRGRRLENGNLELFAEIHIDQVLVDGHAKFEAENGRNHSLYVFGTQSPEKFADIKMQLTFDKSSKSIQVNRFMYSQDNPIFDVKATCVDGESKRFCEDTEAFARILGLRNLGNSICFRLIDAIQSMKWDF